LKTHDFIDALAVDAGTRPAQFGRAFRAGIAIAVLLGAIAFWVLLGPRPDFGAAMETVRFPFKFVVTSLFGAAAAALALRLSRPGDAVGAARWAIFAAPVLLATAVLIELVVMPRDTWMARMIGTHALICLTYVPIISALPLLTVLFVLRNGAPRSPTATGAAAGLLAGAVGTTFYAAQCPDDSPLFVAVWYPLAIAMVACAGAALGSRILRW
jgi:hypothetical protein